MGVAALPGVPGGTGAPLVFARNLWILNLRPKEEQEAAWKFVKWLVEPEQQAEWFAGSGYLPVSRSSVDLPAAQDMMSRYPLFQVALNLYLNAPASPAAIMAALGPVKKVDEAVYSGVEAMLSGGKDPEQALEDAAAEANQAIEEYNQRLDE
jgi:sn-glycerol 3-phosphate transport system substrate-binding protein